MENRYRVAPARPVFLSSASHHRLQPAAGRRSGVADMELDIFTAERYFNAADAIKSAAVRAAPVDVAESQSGRTVVSSEASWNSRSGLLASNQSSAAVRQHDKVARYGGGGPASGNGIDLGVVVKASSDDRYLRGGGKKPGQRWGLFSRDCPCAGRKAVTVDVASEPPSPTTPRIDHARRLDALEERAVFKANGLPPPSANDEPGVMKIINTGTRAFPLRASSSSVLAPASNQGGSASSFPAFPPDAGRRVMSSGSGFTFPVIAPAVADEPPRESLEVFRPIDEDSVVLVDPPPALGAAGFLRAPTTAVAPATDDDAMSDASSDLFDLESFAASSSYPTTYRGRSSRRNSGDDDHLAYATAVAEPALSECMYAPSEASVVWSVATAEGVAYDAGSVANFSSAASACCVDDFRFVPPVSADGFTAAMSRSAGRKKGGGGGFLNSCRCEKAVSVGPTPVRMPRPPAVPAKTASRAMGLESGGVARYHNRRVHMPVRT